MTCRLSKLDKNAAPFHFDAVVRGQMRRIAAKGASEELPTLKYRKPPKHPQICFWQPCGPSPLTLRMRRKSRKSSLGLWEEDMDVKFSLKPDR